MLLVKKAGMCMKDWSVKSMRSCGIMVGNGIIWRRRCRVWSQEREHWLGTDRRRRVWCRQRFVLSINWKNLVKMHVFWGKTLKFVTFYLKNSKESLQKHKTMIYYIPVAPDDGAIPGWYNTRKAFLKRSDEPKKNRRNFKKLLAKFKKCDILCFCCASKTTRQQGW